MTALLARWTEKLAGGPQAGTSDSPHWQGSWEWVDNNNWGGTNSRFLGLVAVGEARSLDQTGLRMSVIKRIRQMTLNT